MRAPAGFCLVLWAMLFSPLRAQSTHSSRPTLRALPLRTGIQIDGRLDEPAWLTTDSADSFTQVDPAEGKPASERTVVRILFDQDALYVGVRLYDRGAMQLHPKVARRDSPSGTDEFAVLIDGFHDHLSAVRLRVALGGAREDATIIPALFQPPDPSWEPVWESATSQDSLGWTVEMRVPLSQLRYNRGGDGTWGIQFERLIYRKHELDVFSFTPKRETAGIAEYGHLTGLAALPVTRDIEMLPYASLQADFLPPEQQSALAPPSRYRPNGGLDFKAGLPNGLTLNGTINPDFGQVEVDPAVVNLSAFETFYPERRPFFVESANRYGFGTIRAWNSLPFPQVFFSRRIGRSPQLGYAGNGVAETPRQTPILGAIKITGHTRRGWSVGLLDALAGTERVRVLAPDGSTGSALAEPGTNYAVARISRELDQGNTTFGMIATSVERSLPGAGAGSLLRHSALTGGFDLGHTWSHRAWAADLSVLGSDVRGSPAAIAATQRSSARYFQRPDQTQVRFDSTRTSLQGMALQASLSRQSGEHWLGSLAYQVSTPGFEVSDLGFESTVGRHVISSDLHWQQNRPGRLLRSYIIWPFTNHTLDFDGHVIDNLLNFWTQAELHNYWKGYVWLLVNTGGIDDKLTRGGPLARHPSQATLTGFLSTDQRRSISISGQGIVARGELGTRQHRIALTLVAREGQNLRLEVGPAFETVHDPAQYVQSVPDPLAVQTFGARYVFADLRQKTVSLDTRIDWTFSPALSLQAYLQPLIASGRYSRFAELRAPRSYRFDVYGRDRGTSTVGADGRVDIDPDGGGPAAPFVVSDPSFTLRSLRGNVVLRWEYHRGATVYFVWQQARDASDTAGSLALGRDLRSLLTHRGRNTLVLKASYWLTP